MDDAELEAEVVLGDPEADQVREAVREVCDALLEDLADRVTVDGGFDAESRVLEVRIASPAGLEFEEAVLAAFFDLFCYLEMDLAQPGHYCFHWTAGGKTWRLETGFSLLPDTGGVTREQWERFSGQLVYVVDGKARTLPEPEFLDDYPEDAE